ncbi:MAG: glycosyl transferase [Candidatus Kaiserbacteria bacterium]|nr:glycosyl transferase [Candidatus Kaiserbacteria bacterium]
MEVASASIIIPTLNEEKYLPLLLNSLQNISSPLDIVVVDGNSEDDTVRVAESYASVFRGRSSLRVIRSPERGISLQRNLGVTIAKHDLLIFCDADVVMPSTESYEKLISSFVARNFVVAAPAFVPTEDGIGLWLTSKVAYTMQKILLLFSKPYFGGAYLMTTRSVFVRVGGFDTTLTLAEDVDYSLKAAKLGLHGLINVRVGASARRLTKYGYGWILGGLPAIFGFIRTGRVAQGSIYYPFGEYGK